jgi:hypothetical protein
MISLLLFTPTFKSFDVIVTRKESNLGNHFVKLELKKVMLKVLFGCAAHPSKGAFFQKVRFVFQISQSPQKIIPRNYPELEI